MATIVFYEKPGCVTNTRQRRALEADGHQVVARSLLSEVWTPARLREFFGAMPVAAWFNPAAPAVKSGAVDPAALDADAALALMLADPLLIRRPLMEADGMHCAGFDLGRLGLAAVTGQAPDGCSRSAADAVCPSPGGEPRSVRQ
jgi:nitrogenase-associated protein